MPTPKSIDANLKPWENFSDRRWETLLLGNGLSINIWSKFKYDSLYRESSLGHEAQAIFNHLETTNFELCLECLQHANISLRSLGEPTIRIDDTYSQVRDALFDTVSKVHVPRRAIPETTVEKLSVELSGYRRIFTTNYDLIPYWSQFSRGDSKPPRLVDFFWSNGTQFDSSDTDLYHPGRSPIFYVHGAVHLWQDELSGRNGKWTSGHSHLLDIRSKYHASSTRRPLFISEGTWRGKLQSIRQSEYLSFCYRELRKDTRPMVIFGSSLSEQDEHIVAAVNAGEPKPIAVSMLPTSEPDLIAEKARIARLLAKHEVHFFDSTTHPLGSATLDADI